MKEEPTKDIFKVIGSFGVWQKKVFVYFFIVNIIGTLQSFVITFMAPNLDYTCITPSSNTSSYDEAYNFTDMAILNSTNQCEVTYVTSRWNVSSNTTTYNVELTAPCTKWEYDTSFYSHTIVSDWDLVCDREWMISFAKSIYMVGFLLSVFTFGQFSDYFGRFPAIMVCYLITATASILSVFSTSYLMFVILRFFSAFGRTGLTTTGYVLLMEIIGPDWRTEIGVIIQFGWCIGMMLLPAVAWFLRPWYWIQLAISLPIIPLACAYWLVPESPRWLMTQGKKVKFIKTIAKAAKQNGKDIKESEIEEILGKAICEENDCNSRKTILDLLRTPIMARRTICMATLWMVNAFVYYALSYNTNDLGGDSFVNFFISAILELPSYAAIFYSVRRFGRKLPLIVGMMLGGVACAGIMVVPAHIHWLKVTFAMIGKFFITATFGLLYLYTAELFPTVVRNVAIGSCSTCARIGSIVAPFVRELEKATHYTVPYALNAAVTIMAAFLVFLLPETKDKKIPDTLEEVEKFGNHTEEHQLKINKFKSYQ